MSWRLLMVALSLLIKGAPPSSQQQSLESKFSLARVRMCLRPQFLHEPAAVPAGSSIRCAAACLQRGDRCQGFWLTDDSSRRCQTLEFDRCSHMVNAANCNKFAWAHVRKQQNLPDGQLVCPPGYSSGYRGSTYKIINVSSWTDGLTRCSSESGLTKFADGMDRAEVDHLHWVKSNVNSGETFFVGGFRVGNFASGTWFWQSCNASFLPEVWLPGQPNEGDSSNRSDVWSSHVTGIDDITDTYSGVGKALCECIDPFV